MSGEQRINYIMSNKWMRFIFSFHCSYQHITMHIYSGSQENIYWNIIMSFLQCHHGLQPAAGSESWEHRSYFPTAVKVSHLKLFCNIIYPVLGSLTTKHQIAIVKLNDVAIPLSRESYKFFLEMNTYREEMLPYGGN